MRFKAHLPLSGIVGVRPGVKAAMGAIKGYLFFYADRPSRCCKLARPLIWVE